MITTRYTRWTAVLALGLVGGFSGEVLGQSNQDQISLSLNLRYTQPGDPSRSTTGDSLLWYDGFVIIEDPSPSARDFVSGSSISSLLSYDSVDDFTSAATRTEVRREGALRFSPQLVLNVPEPTTIALVGICGVVLVTSGRQRRRRAA